MSDLFRLTGGVEQSTDVEAWMNDHPGELGAIARRWFDSGTKQVVRRRPLLAWIVMRVKWVGQTAWSGPAACMTSLRSPVSVVIRCIPLRMYWLIASNKRNHVQLVTRIR